MAKHDAKGRSKNTRFIKIDYWMVQSDAWRSLNPREIAIFLLLLERYNGSNNGRISLSIRESSKLGHMSQNTASEAFKTLTERGFIKIRYKGSFSQKVKLASEYELTHLKYKDRLPTKEFASWKKQIPVLNQMRNGIDLGAISNNDVL